MTSIDLSPHPIIFTQPDTLPYSAWVGHIPFAFFLVDLLRPKVVVELGVHSGASYNAFCQAVAALSLPARCYGVDTWQGDEHAGAYEEDVLERLQAYQKQRYDSFSSLLRMTFDQALSCFSDNGIDLLHIDGCHTYDAVKHDFESWLPKVSPQGVILLHDVRVRERGFGVWRLWDELQERFDCIEFLHSHGLGVVALSDVSPAVRRFMDAMRQAPFCGLLFQTLGQSLVFRLEQENLHARQQAEIRDHLHSMSAMKQEIESLHQGLGRQSDEISNLFRILQEKDQVIAARDREIAAKAQLLADLHNSLSWRITAPLRSLYRPFSAKTEQESP